MKIVFLDIDGVLKTKQGLRRAYANLGKFISDSWDEDAVRNLNKLIEDTGAKIVLTSSWRYGETVENLQQTLKKKGIQGNLIGKSPEIGEITDRTASNISRGHEIEAWLKQQTEEIQYVIIDDDPSLMPEQMRCAVICDMENGFADNAKYKLALTILSGKAE